MPDRHLQVRTAAGFLPLTWPMGLTMLRLLLLPAFLWVILLDARAAAHRHRWLAVAIFAVMAVTDKLDGYLARRLDQTSKIGAVLDPVADKLLVACSVILLSFDWVAPAGWAIPVWVVVAVYGKDLVVAVGAVAMLAVVGRVSITPRPLGKLSTVLQLSMVMATLIAPDLVGWDPPIARRLLHGLWWAVPIVAVLACGDYLIAGFRQFFQIRRQGVALPTSGSSTGERA